MTKQRQRDEYTAIMRDAALRRESLSDVPGDVLTVLWHDLPSRFPTADQDTIRVHVAAEVERRAAASVRKIGKRYEYDAIFTKTSKHKKRLVPGMQCGLDWKAIVQPGEWIRIYGTDTNDTPFDRTFRIGDLAEHDSFNLSYFGPITVIATRTITITSDIRQKASRLDLSDFIRRNRDFDPHVAAARNSETMRYI